MIKTTYNKKCKLCDTKFKCTSKNYRYCTKCKDILRKEVRKKYNKKYYTKKKKLI